MLHCVQFSHYFSFIIQPTNIIFQKEIRLIFHFEIKADLNHYYTNKHICVKRPKTVTFISKYPSKSWWTSSLRHTTPSIRWRRLHGWDRKHLCFPHQLPVTNVRTPTPPHPGLLSPPGIIYINIHSRYRSPGGWKLGARKPEPNELHHCMSWWKMQRKASSSLDAWVKMVKFVLTNGFSWNFDVDIWFFLIRYMNKKLQFAK